MNRRFMAPCARFLAPSVTHLSNSLLRTLSARQSSSKTWEVVYSKVDLPSVFGTETATGKTASRCTN
jgi:hypothetical protein